MTTNGQNFEIYQGDDKELIITVTDDNGAILNLSGYVAVWCVYNQTLENIVFEKRTSNGSITIPTPANGELHIPLLPSDTAALATKVYGHQCEIDDLLGHHSTVTTGYMRVLKSIIP